MRCTLSLARGTTQGRSLVYRSNLYTAVVTVPKGHLRFRFGFINIIKCANMWNQGEFNVHKLARSACWCFVAAANVSLTTCLFVIVSDVNVSWRKLAI